MLTLDLSPKVMFFTSTISHCPSEFQALKGFEGLWGSRRPSSSHCALRVEPAGLCFSPPACAGRRAHAPVPRRGICFSVLGVQETMNVLMGYFPVTWRHRRGGRSRSVERGRRVVDVGRHGKVGGRSRAESRRGEWVGRLAGTASSLGSGRLPSQKV